MVEYSHTHFTHYAFINILEQLCVAQDFKSSLNKHMNNNVVNVLFFTCEDRDTLNALY